MGWRGTLRSVNAAMRAAEREAQRRYRQEQKEAIAADAAQAVDDWEEHIRNLITIHTSLSDTIDWHSVAHLGEPQKPAKCTRYREKLAPAMKSFKPRFFDKLLGGTEKRKQKLINSFLQAKERDAAEDQKALEKYRSDYAEWVSDNAMARKLLAGDPEAMKEVVAEMQSLSAEDRIGSYIEFRFAQGVVHAIAEVHTDEVVPDFRRKQLASGRLSETKMPVGEFNELYQDYVASVALKVAGDLFQILPLGEVHVTCRTNMLDSQTGHMRPAPILSVKFVRETFASLNLEHIDPSDSLRNFVHQMDFKRTKGFEAIQPILPIT